MSSNMSKGSNRFSVAPLSTSPSHVSGSSTSSHPLQLQPEHQSPRIPVQLYRTSSGYMPPAPGVNGGPGYMPPAPGVNGGPGYIATPVVNGGLGYVPTLGTESSGFMMGGPSDLMHNPGQTGGPGCMTTTGYYTRMLTGVVAQPQPNNIPNSSPRCHPSPLLPEDNLEGFPGSPEPVGSVNQSPPRYDKDKRLRVTPINKGFLEYDSNKLVTDVIKSVITDFFSSWEKVDTPTRSQMFRVFKARAFWLPQYNDLHIQNCFFAKASDRYRAMTSRMCSKKKQPKWMSLELYTQFEAHWKTPDFIAQSEQNKKNRSSATGGSLHTGGSKNLEAIKMQMTNDLGRPVPQDEAFMETHTRKIVDGKRLPKGTRGPWVEPRAGEVHYNFQCMKVQKIQLEASAGNSYEPTAVQDLEMWAAASGGRKRGRIYGTSTTLSVSRVRVVAEYSSATKLELARVTKELEKAQKKLNKQTTRNRQITELLSEAVGRPIILEPSDDEEDEEHE